MNNERMVGYSLLAVGIVIMAVAVYLIYLVFTNEIRPFQVFQSDLLPSAQRSPASIQELMTDSSALMQMQSQILSQVLEKQISRTMNMGATIFLMYFVMLFGFRVATLGVQMVRPIQVTVREASGKLLAPPKPPKEM